MQNNVFILGRSKNNIEVENEKAQITIIVNRAIKNMDGEYETDEIPVRLMGVIAQQSEEYIEAGSLVGVTGELRKEGEGLVVFAKRISFLAPKKETE